MVVIGQSACRQRSGIGGWAATGGNTARSSPISLPWAQICLLLSFTRSVANSPVMTLEFAVVRVGCKLAIRSSEKCITSLILPKSICLDKAISRLQAPTTMAQRRQLDTFDWSCQLLPEESLILLLDSVLVRTRCGGATSSIFRVPTTQLKPLTPPLALVQTTFPNATEVYPTWAGAGRRRGVAGTTNRFSGGLIGKATRCRHCQYTVAITLVPGRHQARH